jgi:hypothetical protein
MLGSFTQAARAPAPLRLAARLLVAAILVLYPLHVLERVIVEPLVPALGEVTGVLDGQFVVTDARIEGQASNEILRFRANLTRPMEVAGSVVYPFGRNGLPEGGYQVRCSVSGVLLYSGLLLIIVCAWPVRGARELALRLLMCIPLAAALLLIDVPTTVVAELRQIVVMQADPHGLSLWMIWSRFLMGGGGIAMAICFAALAITAGRRYSPPPAQLNGAAVGSRDGEETSCEQSV